MNPIQRFVEYAAAFEQTFESGDTSHIEPFFTEDAVYETFGAPPFAGCQTGRDAVFTYLLASLDGFDRRFATRDLELLEGPALRDGSVWIRWRGRYTRPGLPDLVIEGEESATFDGDRIARLEDRFTIETAQAALAYLEEHADVLRVDPD